jgi:hypothetical protein
MVSRFLIFAALSAFGGTFVAGLITRQSQEEFVLTCRNPDAECVSGPGGQFSAIWNVTGENGPVTMGKQWRDGTAVTLTCVDPK